MADIHQLEKSNHELRIALTVARSYVQEWCDYWSVREQVGITPTIRKHLDEIDEALNG